VSDSKVFRVVLLRRSVLPLGKKPCHVEDVWMTAKWMLYDPGVMKLIEIVVSANENGFV